MTSASVIPADVVGAVAGPLHATIDARWLMAYAAAAGADDARYFDTAAAGGPAAHPVFPVCYEWPAVVALRAKTLPEAIARRGVHALHHVVIHRSPRAGDVLLTTARVAALSQRRAGALVVLALDTVDADGRPVTTTLHGSVYRGVSVERDVGTAEAPVVETPDGWRWDATLLIAATAGHVYTECARIWNPIHTDVAAARAAGLPAPILHGTATLALAVSRIVARDLDGDPTAVGALAVRFTAPVVPPATVTVRVGGAAPISFDAVGLDGAPVLSQGALWPRPR